MPWGKIVFGVTDTTPELTRGNRTSQFHEFTGELTPKAIPTFSNVVNGSNCRTQLLVEESRVVYHLIESELELFADHHRVGKLPVRPEPVPARWGSK